MKKMFLMTVAMFCMTATFAENENASNAAEANAYDMTVNIRRLGNTLGLTLDQMETVADIHRTFCGEMMIAAQAHKDDRSALVAKAVDKDLKYMRYVLTEDQFCKYSMLLHATLENRGLEK